jgi:electron transfer flavoprotein beta subunit
LTKIIVLIKDIVDLKELKFDPTTRRPNTDHVKHRISELDKRALEAAIRVKEKHGGEVLTLSLGGEKTKSAILEALAMGADAAYIINDDLDEIDSLATSKVLAAAVKKIGCPDIILCGEMSLDRLSSQVGPRLAEILNLPQVTYARQLNLENGKVIAERDLEDVDEVVAVDLPVVVSVVREINEPRIPSLINIMRAKRKPLSEWEAMDLGLSTDEVKSDSSIEVIKVEAPIIERKRIKIKAETVEETAQKLAELIISEGMLER